MVSQRIADKLAYWRERLLDLSRRNRLLYYKRTKGSTFVILEPEPQAVVERLLGGKSWLVWRPPDPDDESTTLPEMYEEFRSEENRVRSELELQTDIDDPKHLDKVLLNLLRKSYTDYQERGVRTLQVAVGMVEWTETGTSEPVRSPLLLIPVQLQREDARSPMQLLPTEEDIIVNPALEVKLQTDFNIALPEPPDDWENGNAAEYISSVRDALAPMGWHVEDSALVGLFSFHKLVIYRDLTANAEVIADHRVIRALSGEESPNWDAGDIRTEPDMDGRHTPREPYQILDADSSQQVCIQAMLDGKSIVVQGPPGTGKSQTIANMIAECIARGRSVLFVSEKMAALEVVHRRLVDRGLHDFCLELHSHKANKRDVAKELERCLLETPTMAGGLAQIEVETLVKAKTDLNAYVKALHATRPPSNWTAYRVLGWLARHSEFPTFPTGIPNIPAMTDERLADLASRVARMQHVWLVVEEGEAFPWLGYIPRDHGILSKQSLGQSLDALALSLSELELASAGAARMLGVPEPEDLAASQWLLDACRLVERSPSPQRNWLTDANIQDLISDASGYADLCKRHRSECEALSSAYGEHVLGLPEASPTLFEEHCNKLQRLLGASEVLSDQRVFSERRSTADILVETSNLCKKWLVDADRLAQALGMSVGRNLGQVRDLAELACLCGSADRPDESWLDPGRLRTVRDELPSYIGDIQSHNTQWAKLQQVYDESVLQLDLDLLLEKFTGVYSWPVRWVLPGYHRASRSVRRTTRTGSVPNTLKSDLVALREVLRLRTRIDAKLPELRDLLRFYYRGYETDFGRVGKALQCAERSLTLARTSRLPEQLAQLLSATGSVDPDLPERGRRVVQEVDQQVSALSSSPLPIPAAALSDTGDTILRSVSLSKLDDWASLVSTSLNVLNGVVDQMVAADRSFPADTFHQVADDLRRLEGIRQIERGIAEQSDRLHRAYGARFQGLDTDWPEVLAALAWCSEVATHFGYEPLPADFVDICTTSGLHRPDVPSYDAALSKCRSGLDDLCKLFVDGRPRYDGRYLLDLRRREIADAVQRLRNRLDDLQVWLDYQDLLAEADQVGLGQFVRTVVDCQPQRQSIDDIFLGSVYSEWLEALYQQDGVLSRFRRESHEQIVEHFRKLDRKSVLTANASVVKEAAARRPSASAAALAGSEASVIRREANKKRRHLPIRKLFKAIPNTLFQLKPCLLMSPLSVSQFLGATEHHFDTVIFDEASQICPEDSVGAIYRGDQLIVAGDKKQLPPTRFFQKTSEDAYVDDDDDDENLEDYESILDECSAIGMPDLMLRWHYRSRHESLIAFSNHWFYDDRLVTFPSAVDEHDTLGVKFDYVENGIYDRGGARDNKIEAERVAELVFEHFVKRPSKTLGVVAFSQAQMTAIDDAIERRLRQQPLFDRFFRDDRLEGFFVKNLENVQGDERDVLIFSVGYGKDAQGRMATNFGPLNKAGGERRLNVQITRAREMVIVVSSIRADDIDLKSTNATGALMLHHYLDYAEHGPDVLRREASASAGEPDSQFEIDVAAAIREMGYECVPQVGCSSYRIDIGVLDPAKPGRYILGVECDGATYHSAYTARDRDRLRQAVLENLGWRIHRIWSPDWVARRDTELQRLRQAIDAARERITAGDLFSDAPQTVSGADAAQPQEVEYVKQDVPDEVDVSDIPGVRHYVACQLPPVSWGSEKLADPLNQKAIRALLCHLAEREGPIHLDHAIERIKAAHGTHRAGSRIREAVNIAAAACQTQKRLRVINGFLWKHGDDSVAVRTPADGDPLSVRRLDWVSDPELATAAKLIVKHFHAIDEDALVRTCTRLYGFDRTGHIIGQRLGGIVQALVKKGVLVRHGGNLTMPNGQ